MEERKKSMLGREKKRVEKEVKMSLKRQSIDSHRLRGVKKNKPRKDGKYAEFRLCILVCFL